MFLFCLSPLLIVHFGDQMLKIFFYIWSIFIHITMYNLYSISKGCIFRIINYWESLLGCCWRWFLLRSCIVQEKKGTLRRLWHFHQWVWGLLICLLKWLWYVLIWIHITKGNQEGKLFLYSFSLFSINIVLNVFFLTDQFRTVNCMIAYYWAKWSVWHSSGSRCWLSCQYLDFIRLSKFTISHWMLFSTSCALSQMLFRERFGQFQCCCCHGCSVYVRHIFFKHFICF